MAFAGACHPRALTEAVVNHWVASARANNTRRNRLTRVCTFLRWCVRQGQADLALVEDLQSRDNPLRATPPLYGKLQGVYPARWLTYEEAYVRLLGGCDSSDVGRRDELVLRLGLAGMRVAEMIDDGAHYFDLLDIQKVLGHANPATTMRSYIDPLDTAVIRRAAGVLD